MSWFQDNFGKFIHQFQPEFKTLIRKLERILIIYIYIYIYIYLFFLSHYNLLFLTLLIIPNYTSSFSFFLSSFLSFFPRRIWKDSTRLMYPCSLLTNITNPEVLIHTCIIVIITGVQKYLWLDGKMIYSVLCKGLKLYHSLDKRSF